MFYIPAKTLLVVAVSIINAEGFPVFSPVVWACSWHNPSRNRLVTSRLAFPGFATITSPPIRIKSGRMVRIDPRLAVCFAEFLYHAGLSETPGFSGCGSFGIDCGFLHHKMPALIPERTRPTAAAAAPPPMADRIFISVFKAHSNLSGIRIIRFFPQRAMQIHSPAWLWYLYNGSLLPS